MKNLRYQCDDIRQENFDNSTHRLTTLGEFESIAQLASRNIEYVYGQTLVVSQQATKFRGRQDRKD